MQQSEDMTREAMMITLTNVVAATIIARFPDFYDLVGETIDTNIAISCKDILRKTKTTMNIIDEIMNEIEPKIPEELYAVLESGLNNKDENAVFRQLVKSAFRRTIANDTIKLVEMFKHTMEG